jgi:hypothetical protein
MNEFVRDFERFGHVLYARHPAALGLLDDPRSSTWDLPCTVLYGADVAVLRSFARVVARKTSRCESLHLQCVSSTPSYETCGSVIWSPLTLAHVQMLQDMCKTLSIDGERRFVVLDCADDSYGAMPMTTQLALRKLIENTEASLFVILTRQLGYIGETVLGRCALLRLGYDRDAIREVVRIMTNSDERATAIASRCDASLTRALWMCETDDPAREFPARSPFAAYIDALVKSLAAETDGVKAMNAIRTSAATCAAMGATWDAMVSACVRCDVVDDRVRHMIVRCAAETQHACIEMRSENATGTPSAGDSVRAFEGFFWALYECLTAVSVTDVEKGAKKKRKPASAPRKRRAAGA